MSGPESVGGGGSSRNVQGSPSADQIQDSVGGGVVAGIFRDLPHSVWGGVVPYIFTLTTGADQSIFINCVNYGTFFYNYGQPQRNNINSLQKKKNYKKFGEGHGPPGPPPGYATVSLVVFSCHMVSKW